MSFNITLRTNLFAFSRLTSREAHAEAPQQPKVDVEQSKPQPTPSEEKEQEKGLSLRFSSDQALMSLIQQNTIKFYVVKNKQYFN